MSDSEEYRRLRLDMVDTQLKGRDIYDSNVLKAMAKVERHRFVPSEYANAAYSDGPLPIGHSQTISQPYIVALMTQLLNLKGGEKILEVGTGSGYQAAMLAELCKEVYTVEIIPELGERAGLLLKELGYGNVFVKIGDGYNGWPEHAPYDGILVTCAPDAIPQPLISQLKEGGRLVIPVGGFPDQVLVLAEKLDGNIVKEGIIPVRFVPLVRKKADR
jgi:protein-L-isoaspartate(D-aspartate) O-methyltransferase